MWVGMENGIANFHCKEMSTKNAIAFMKQMLASNFVSKIHIA